MEKQFDVYEDTISKYEENVDTGNKNVFLYQNELNKHKSELSNLEKLFNEFSVKNRVIDDEIKKYEKISVCLDVEMKKLELSKSSGSLL
ncbi:hypothetical protein NAPIS_ORF02660 [Vairimorpha apis BRL 01]|uniref:Uncharacterized protein n=1 Tax=Vairimorpha apis BRL 01 TaxID=1037528 RepID=T0M8K6_9MICR|nr:hypothetical protein NAPIS_ORF02660 [Vairimorpha apis BRL 01]